MDNLETLLATIVDTACGNKGGFIVERLIKPRASTIFCHPVYSLDGPGTSMAVSGTDEEIFNSSLEIWMGGKNFHMVAVDQLVCTKYGGP